MSATPITDRTDLIPLSAVARRLPGRPHRATVWRWARDGIATRRGRAYLRVVRLGRRVFVAPAALDEFVGALSEAYPARGEGEVRP